MEIRTTVIFSVFDLCDLQKGVDPFIVGVLQRDSLIRSAFFPPVEDLRKNGEKK